MIQIIGFLICACLAVKLLEMGANPAFKKEDGGLVPGIGFAIVFGWCAFAGFILWLMAQGESIGQAQASVQNPMDCVLAARTVEEMNACPK